MGRPAEAGEVARAVAAYQAGVADRLRAAEVERAGAEVRVSEERKWRRAVQRRAWAVAAILLLGVIGTTAGLVWADWPNRLLREVLDAAARNIETRFARRQEIAADLRDTIGGAYRSLGDLTAAELHLRAALGLREKVLGPDHPDTLASVNNLGVISLTKGDLRAAEPLLRRALAGREKVLGPDHPDTLQSVGNLGVLLGEAGRASEGVPFLERVYAARAKYPAQFGRAGGRLADAYAADGRAADAKGVVAQMVVEGRAKVKSGSPGLGELLATAGQQLLAWDPAAAEPVLRECLELRQKLAPAAWDTANAKSSLGDALLRQGKPIEAVPLLVAGYEGLVADAKNIPPQARSNLPDPASRLAQVYLALGKPDEAAKWRTERAKYPPDIAPRPRPVVRLAPPPRELSL